VIKNIVLFAVNSNNPNNPPTTFASCGTVQVELLTSVRYEVPQHCGRTP